MNKYLTINEVENYWKTLINEDVDFFIYTLATKNISRKWEFYFRNKIIEMIAPEKIKIGTLKFDKNYCVKESELSKKNSNYLSIHSVMIRDLIESLNSNSYCLILDIDAFPLSEFALKLTFVLAMKKGINGNIQRTNCIENGNHLFIGPSYLCFKTKSIKELKDSAWIVNERSDVSEEITWEMPELIDHHLFRPTKNIFKPIWFLDDAKPVYGIGTTFGYNNYPINYHHFYSRAFIARIHFCLISFLNYLKIKVTLKIKKKSNFKSTIIDILKEFNFSIKYLLGKIL